MIAVVDCGMGNIESVLRALRRVGGQAVASSSASVVEAADKIVLPGVGSFAQGMESLRRNRLLDVLADRVLERGVPVLGICLGHQMLTARSEEGDVPGLGWIDGEALRLPGHGGRTGLKVPHIGWSTLEVRRPTALLDGVAPDACFYFAHSYAVTCRDPTCVVATTEYGDTFVSAVQKDNVFGTQFHPEKSQANGLRVLENFLGWGGRA